MSGARGLATGMCLVWAGLVAAACHDDDHGHGHGHGDGHEAPHDHGEAAHGDHEHPSGHRHGEEHPPGHDHHAEAHGHDEPVVRITRWNDELELFAEHTVAVAGKPVEWLVHLTELDGFRAVTEGRVALELDGPERLEVESAIPLRPGIYQLELKAAKAGEYRGRLRLVKGDWTGEIGDITLTVHPNDGSAAAHAPGKHDDEDAVSFLKEQQWKVRFATAFVAQGSVAPAVQVPGSVDTPPGGMAEVSAPIAGRLVAPPGGLPRPGQRVAAGELLAKLAPAPSSPEGEARARLALVESEARVRAARTNLERAERLMADEAISRRELEDARRELEVATESVTAAKQVSALFAGARAGRGSGSWKLTAPIAGVLVTADARPGAGVAPDDVLFRVVNRDELWLKARVPEQDAARLQPGADASYRIAGLDEWLPLTLEGEAANASLVTISSVVDPKTRSVDVIYALREPEPRLRVDGLVTLELPVGEPFRGSVVPKSAVVEQDGRSLVYVQLDGEHFEERAVRLGPAASGRVGVIDGLADGERIVTEGASLLRLSARSSGQQPHGHIH